MGKFSTGWVGAEEEDPDERKKKLKKDLEQIRQNALGRKRDLRSRDSLMHKPRAGLIKNLNQFASQRRKIEEATEITQLINKPRIIKQEVIPQRDLQNIRGFFRAGVKGRELTRRDPAFEKFRNGVLQSDALQILQSGNFGHRSEENQQQSENTKSPIEDDHVEIKMEVAKILSNFNSSKNTSFDLDNPGSIEFPFSPVIGRCKGAKKRISHKTAVNENHKKLYSQENEFSLVNNNINKGEKYKRRLFDEVTAGINEKCNEIPKNVLRNNGAFRNSTPENVIFYSEVISREPANKIKKHPQLEFSDPDLIKYYVKICKIMGTNDLKNMFKNKYKDPEETAREALKITYKRAMKDYQQRQKCHSKNDSQTTPSNNSEIWVEPDSDVARILKRNVAFQKQKELTTTPSNSIDSTKNFVNIMNARSLVNTAGDNDTKKKHAPSSKGSETEVPSSTQAIADPKSVRADLKMNNIHPDRQELVARFLEDQKSFEASQGIEGSEVHKEDLYFNSNPKEIFMQKNTKYVPAILRKNRSLVECVAKEKASILSAENYPSQRNNKLLMLENAKSERTPNTVTDPVLEAPKCKYVHINAKYNQPSRISVPAVQNNRYQRNPVPERHSQRFPSPNSVQKNFTLSQTYNMSPIKQFSSYQSDTSHDFHLCQLSQESQNTNDGHGMTRMVSFGDIQDRTNRLTLCSQNQNCSQESMEHAYASQRPHSNYHYQPCESTNSCSQFAKQPHVSSFAEPSYDRLKCECSSTLGYIDCQPYVTQNEFQKISQSESNSCNCCHQKSKEQGTNCPVSMPSRQPIKYHGAEGNRRQPIYNPNESYSFVHKPLCCSSSRGGESSDFEYLDMLKMNYGGGDCPQSSFALPNGNQRYIVQRQILSSPVCQQVAYRHNHRIGNESYKMNDACMHQMNRQMHSKRQ